MKRSPTDFLHLFKNHEPEHVFNVLMASADDLHEKKIVKFKWFEHDQDALTIHFMTRARFKYNSSHGFRGEGICVPSELGGTEFLLHLVKDFDYGGNLLGSLAGKSLLDKREVDFGEGKDIWNAIIREINSHLNSQPQSQEKPKQQTGEGQLVEESNRDSTDSHEDTVSENKAPLAETVAATTQPHFSGTKAHASLEPVVPNTSELPITERLDLIDRLIDLRQSGYLSEAEFSEQKNQLIYRP